MLKERLLRVCLPLAMSMLAAIAWAAPGDAFVDIAQQASAPARAAAGEDGANVLFQRVSSGELASMNDQSVVALFSQTSPAELAGYLDLTVKPLGTYEIWLQRQERIRGTWNDSPFLNHMLYQHEPRRIYVKWLDGGPHSGQEILYDEGQRKDKAYGHLGGFLNVTSIWMSLDGMLVTSNTNHNVRDELSMQFFAQTLGQRLRAMQASGTRTVQSVEIVSAGDQRGVAFVLPAVGPKAALYDGKVRFVLDLRQPMLRQFEGWDGGGVLVERITVDRLKAVPLTTADFDPKNKSYHF